MSIDEYCIPCKFVYEINVPVLLCVCDPVEV
jgi:hypothetical protein